MAEQVLRKHPVTQRALRVAGRSGDGRSGEDRPPRPEVGAPLRSTACPHKSEDRGHPDKKASFG